MRKSSHPLTPAEWYVMECLWLHAPCTGKEVCDYLSDHVGWSRSTALTMLRRMSEKGLISYETDNGIRTYSPLLRQEDAIDSETDGFLERVYHGSVSMMLSTFTKRQSLSGKEIEELYAILEKAKEDARHD